MDDAFEAQLRDAGRVELSALVRAALAEVVEDACASKRRWRPRRLGPAVGLGAVLVLAAPVAVAATQWGPWALDDPDLVVARDWFYVDGTPMGTCESRLEIQDLPDEVQSDAVAYFDALDVAGMEPDAEYVAGRLLGLGRLDEIGEFIEGAQPEDSDVSYESEVLLDASVFTDARVMQDALMDAVHGPLAAELLSSHPDAFPNGFEATWETQCATAPTADQP